MKEITLFLITLLFSLNTFSASVNVTCDSNKPIYITNSSFIPYLDQYQSQKVKYDYCIYKLYSLSNFFPDTVKDEVEKNVGGNKFAALCFDRLGEDEAELFLVLKIGNTYSLQKGFYDDAYKYVIINKESIPCE